VVSFYQSGDFNPEKNTSGKPQVVQKNAQSCLHYGGFFPAAKEMTFEEIDQ
jgi:hypothetical protein